MRLAYQFPRSNGQRSGLPDLLMLTHIVQFIFQMARPTNFRLGIRMKDDDPHQPQVPWPQRSRSQGHVVSLSHVGPMAHKSKTNSHSITKICTWYSDSVPRPGFELDGNAVPVLFYTTGMLFPLFFFMYTPVVNCKFPWKSFGCKADSLASCVHTCSDVILPVKYDFGLFTGFFYRQVVNCFSCINNVFLH